MAAGSRILFRADGGAEMGLGHMIRTSALAAALKQDYTCILLTRCTVPEILKDMYVQFDEVITLQDLSRGEEPGWIAGHFSGELIVLDGYHFHHDYQKLLAVRCSVFCIDDIHAYPFLARVIINHSGGLTPQDYKAPPYTKYYLGLQYALLRPDFLSAARERRRILDSDACLICFGGADPDNRTRKVLEDSRIRTAKKFGHFHVVVGSAYRYFDDLQQYCSGRKEITLHRALDTLQMIDVMKQCAYAVCSPSTIVYEYMSVGGVVFLEQIADNQTDVIRYMTGEGLAFGLDDLPEMTEDRAIASLQKQAEYFDGRSGERFRKLFAQHFQSLSLQVRKVAAEDVHTCFRWANDPAVRAQSFHPEAIHLEEHVRWFEAKLQDPDSFFYLIEKDRNPVAQIRFQVSGNEAVISYLADPGSREGGMGTNILSLGIEKFIQDRNLPVTIVGLVKAGNIASQRSFERLAFIKETSTEHPGSFKYSMRYGN